MLGLRHQFATSMTNPFGHRRRGAAFPRRRYIRTGNGSSTSAALNDGPTFTGDFSASFVLTPLDATTTRGFAFDSVGALTNWRLQSGVIVLTTNGVNIIGTIPLVIGGENLVEAVRVGTTLTLYVNGVADGSNTVAGDVTIDEIMKNSATFWLGPYLSARLTGTTAGGEIDDFYDLNNDSLTTQYAVGEASPSTKYITYTNFIASDIGLYTWDAVNVEWVGVELYTDGPAWAFDGTEPLFATISAEASTVGSVYRYRFILNNYTSGTVQHKPAGVITGNYVAITDVSGVVTAVSAAQVIKATVTPCIASGTWSVKHAIPRAY